MIITVLKLGEWFLCIIEFSPPVYLVVVHPYLGTYTNMQELDGLNRDAVLKESSTHCALFKLSAMDVFCQIIACSRFLYIKQVPKHKVHKRQVQLLLLLFKDFTSAVINTILVITNHTYLVDLHISYDYYYLHKNIVIS